MDRQTGFPATCGFECGGGSGISGFILMMARAPAVAAFGGTGFNFDLTLTQEEPATPPSSSPSSSKWSCTPVAVSCYRDALLPFRALLWVCGCCCSSCVFVSLFSSSPPHLGSTTWTWSCMSGWTALTNTTISFIPNSITSSWTLHSGCHVPLS